jgi:hypothetical protein
MLNLLFWGSDGGQRDHCRERFVSRAVSIEVRFPLLIQGDFERFPSSLPNAKLFCVGHVVWNYTTDRFTGCVKDQ